MGGGWLGGGLGREGAWLGGGSIGGGAWGVGERMGEWVADRTLCLAWRPH